MLHTIEVYRGRPIYYSIGNFLFYSFAEEPARDRAYPSYSWRTLQGEPNRCGGLARVTWSDPGQAPEKTELLQIWLDDAGEPGPIGADRAHGAVERVAACSKKLGTSFRANGGVVEIV